MKNFLFYTFLILTSTNYLIAQNKQAPKSNFETNLCGTVLLEKLNKMPACAEVTTCQDPDIRDSYLYNTSQPIKIVKTKIRIIRETDGTNPSVTLERVALQMHHLNLNYAPYGIQFTYIIDYVDDSNFRTLPNNITIQQVLDLMAMHISEEDQYCNIFVSSGPFSLGIQPWLNNIGSLGVYMSELYPNNNRNTLTHEIGHALGLLHTFFGFAEVSCGYACAENMVNNGDLTGDFCADTPPQDRSFNAGFTQTTDTCNNIPFNAIPHINYMSYSDNKLEFTPQQVARMHCYFGTFDNRSGWLDTTNPEIPYIFEDDFGYSFTTEEDINPNEWIDITTIGTEVQGLADDNVVGPLNIGFNANYYDNLFNEIYIGSNGYISNAALNINSVASPFPNIPNQDANNGFFAPFLSDLNFAGAGNIGKVYFWSNQTDTFIVTFQNVPFYSPATGFEGNNTFQLVYNKIDKSLRYNYLTMNNYYPINLNQIANPSIIGIESPDGLNGLEVNNYRIPKNNSSIIISLDSDALSIADENLNLISVYPNPTNDFLHIDFNNTSNYNLSIFDYTGKLIHQKNGLTSNYIWDRNGIANGVYFVSVTTEDGKSMSQKIILN